MAPEQQPSRNHALICQNDSCRKEFRGKSTRKFCCNECRYEAQYSGCVRPGLRVEDALLPAHAAELGRIIEGWARNADRCEISQN